MICGNGWCVIENPKCATQSFRAALPESYRTQNQHQYIWDKLEAFPVRCVVVRNPFDRIVSGWRYNGRLVDFSRWLKGAPWMDSGLDIKRTPQVTWAWNCNHVIRFEEIEDGWEKFLRKVNLPYRKLPHVNSTQHDHYKDIIGPEARQIIEDRFYPDMAAWGYRW